ncbi:MAG TPA: MBL fold metallo-hydrolase [Glycomyces sp.]|nr:MBL fold metallo-hydrolase [Glycomyces sp.]
MERTLELESVPAVEGPSGHSVCFIGNATVLLRFGGFTILTDPTFVHRHERVPLGYGRHTERLTDPACDVADLPALDFVLLSHFHGDHFDQVAERELYKGLPIVTTPQAQEALAERGFHNAHGLDTWERLTVAKDGSRLRLTACPGRHGPGVTDPVPPEVMGTVLECEPEPGRPRRVYISGDTLVFDRLHEIPEHFPDIDLALLHLGGARITGVLVTMDAEQGVEAVGIIDPDTVVPVHYDDYDVFTSSLEEFLEAATTAGMDDRVRPLERGETYTFR